MIQHSLTKGLRAAALAAAFLASFLFSAGAYAQKNVNVSGTVYDKSGEPVIGAGVLVKGGTLGTITDVDGSWSLSVPSGSTLTFEAIGYKLAEEQVAGRTRIDVVLEDDRLALDEAVVIGYGTMRKGDLTSAVASVKPEDFNTGNIRDAAELVKGKVAGLTITRGSGDPNSGSVIRLRGVTTLQGDLTPLILIDGIPGDMSTVAPENIADISVLKDASAAAIYGTRGANGVIIITTKGGQFNERLHASYSGYVSLSRFVNNMDFITADDMRGDYKGATTFADEGATTDWLGAITQTGISQNHALTLEGGTKNTAYAAGISFRKEEGTIINTGNENLRMNIDVTHQAMNGMLKFNLSTILGYNTYQQNNPSYAYRQAVIHNPTSPIYNEDGTYNEKFSLYQYYNPVEILNEQVGDYKGLEGRMTGNITFEPIKGWKTNLMLSRALYMGTGENFYTSQYYSYAPAHLAGSSDAINGSASKSQSDSREDNLELTTSYEHNWDKHRLSAIAGYSYNYNVYSGFGASNSNFPTETYLYNSLQSGAYSELKKTLNDDGSIATATLKNYGGVSSYKNDNKLIGFFGRISYGYDNRYNVLVSLRREGSSKFGSGRKWGNFPSASLGWTISNEDFMEGTRGWLDNLKLRAGYGKTGIIAGSSYLSLTMYDYDTSYGRYVNTDGDWVAGLVTTQNPNPYLQWETTNEINVGVDASFFGERLSVSADVYRKVTDDLIYYYTVPVPPNIYTSTTANAAQFKNVGVELMINAIPVQTRDFTWSTTLTASHNKSKLMSLSNELYETESYMNWGGVGDPISVSTHRIEEGYEFGNFWMLKSVGVNEKGKFVIENPNAVTYDSAAGVWYNEAGEEVDRYVVYGTDYNSDEYRQYVGNGMPKVYLNWTNNLQYKNWDFSMQISSQLGFQIFNSQRAFYENRSIAYNRLRSSQYGKQVVDLKTGQPTGEYALLSTSQQQCVVTEYLEQGDFLKIDNVSIGYTYECKGAVKDYLKSVRAYLTANNLLILTGYSGIDPELSNSDPFSAGLDERDKYPTIRSITFGVNLNF